MKLTSAIVCTVSSVVCCTPIPPAPAEPVGNSAPVAPCCQTSAPPEPSLRTTRPLPEAYIDRIKALEGWRSCEKNGINGYNTKAEVPGECIPRIVGNDRLYDELLRDAMTVDAVNRDLPIGTRAALVSLTHNVGSAWTSSYLGRYVHDGRWELARELFVAYVGDGTPTEQAALLRRRRIELSWFSREGPPVSTRPLPPPAAPAGPTGWRFDERGLRDTK